MVTSIVSDDVVGQGRTLGNFDDTSEGASPVADPRYQRIVACERRGVSWGKRASRLNTGARSARMPEGAAS